jgi:hypothetical protein
MKSPAFGGAFLFEDTCYFFCFSSLGGLGAFCGFGFGGAVVLGADC